MPHVWRLNLPLFLRKKLKFIWIMAAGTAGIRSLETKVKMKTSRRPLLGCSASVAAHCCRCCPTQVVPSGWGSVSVWQLWHFNTWVTAMSWYIQILLNVGEGCVTVNQVPGPRSQSLIFPVFYRPTEQISFSVILLKSPMRLLSSGRSLQEVRWM